MIVIEMEDDNFITRVYDNRTGKVVDYRIDYVKGDKNE